MNPFLGAVAACVCAVGGVLLGRFCARLPRPYWALGYFIPLILLMACALALHYPAISFVPPISWLMLGRKKFVLAGFVATMVLTTPLSRLPQKRDRLVVSLLMAVFVLAMSVWPFLAPLSNRRELEHLLTNIGTDGVCRQTTGYTCGPAAAVTLLRKLGLPAEEGKIGILSSTSASTGTPPDLLADALQNYYRRAGLIAEYRAFNGVAELKQAGLTLAVIKFGFMVDHYVAVLEVTDSEVLVGDPLDGLTRMSHEAFESKWRFTGVVLKRPSPGPVTGL